MRSARVLATTAVLLVLAYIAAGNDNPLRGFSLYQPGDYYNRLAEGMRQGHLWMNIPYDPASGAPVPQYNDASYYHGHFYLYFGPVPVVVLLLPVLFLTGTELPLNLAILAFVAAGFVLQAAVFSDARRKFFPSLPGLLEALGIVFLGAASQTPILFAAQGVYETAIAAEYCFLSAGLFCLYRALTRSSGTSRWYSLAGLAGGLAVGARPTAIFFLPLLAGAALLFTERGRRLRVLLAAVLPPAAIGAVLAAYNVARFGRVLELGLTYQASRISLVSRGLYELRFLPANLWWYLFAPPNFSPYFPYFLPQPIGIHPSGYLGYEQVHGVFALGLLLVATMAAVVVLRVRQIRPPALLERFGWIIGACAASLGLYVCLLAFSADRYAVDFCGPLVLALVLASGWALTQVNRVWRVGVATLMLASIATCLLYPLTDTIRIGLWKPHTLETLTRLGNLPSYWAYRLNLIHYGPRTVIVEFPERAAAPIELILSTGSPFAHDAVQTVAAGPGRIELAISHEDYGQVKSRPLAIAPGQQARLELDMGSFYPPRRHPFFDGWTAAEIERVKTTARICIDGKEVLRTRIAFFDSPPGNIAIGAFPGSPFSSFSGRVSQIHRLPLRDPRHDPAFLESGMWRISLEPQLKLRGVRLPVLCAGITGAGHEILLESLSEKQVRFGLDSWGFPVVYSAPISTDLGPHQVEIFAGRQALEQFPEVAAGLSIFELTRARNSLVVWWDGKAVATWTLPVFGNAFEGVALGANSQGFSTTGQIYVGPFESQPFDVAEARAFARRNLQVLWATQR